MAAEKTTKRKSFEEIRAAVKGTATQSTAEKKKEDEVRPSFEDIKARVKQEKENEAQKPVFTSFDKGQVKDWYSGVEAISKRGYEYLTQEGYKKVDTEILNQIDSYLKQADYVGEFIYANKNAYEDFDAALLSYRDVVKYLKDMRQGIQTSNDFFKKFKNQEEYNFWDTHSTPEKRQAWYADLESQLKALKAEKEAHKTKDFDWTDGAARKKHKEEEKAIDAQIAAIETEINNYKRGNYNEYGQHYGTKVVDDYHLRVTKLPSFSADSAFRDYGNPTREMLDEYDAMSDSSTWTYDENDVLRDVYGNEIAKDSTGKLVNLKAQDDKYVVKDPLGLYLSATESEIEEWMGTIVTGTWGEIIGQGYDGHWEELTPDEIGIYYALRKDSQEAADEFLYDMRDELKRRALKTSEKKWKTTYEDAGVLGKIGLNALTVPTNLLSLFPSARTMSNAIRGATAEDLDKYKFLGEFFTVGDLYQSGMSMLDSLAARAVAGPYGGVILATGAASNEANRLYQQGASTGQIAAGAILAGAAELIFESISIGELNKIKNWTPSGRAKFFKALLVQGGVEASEETLTEIANTISNAFVMGSQSDWAALMEENGGNLKDALLQKTVDVLHAGVGGFFSGAPSGGLVSASATAAENSVFRSDGKDIMNAEGGVDALKQLALDVAGASDAKMQKSLTRQAGKVSSEIASGTGLGKIGAAVKNRSNAKKVGRLYSTTQTANNLANASQNKADIAKSLRRKGFNVETANDLADALVASYNGQPLTKAQSKLLESVENSTELKKVISDIVTNTKSTMGQRSQNIRDFDSDVRAGLVSRATGVSLDVAKEFVNGNNAVKESIAESQYEVSVEGKTFQKSTGNVLQVKRFDSVGGKDATVVSDSGEKVKMSDVSWGTEGAALVMQSIPDIDHIDTKGANAILQAYRAGGDSVPGESFIAGAAHVFKSGFFNAKPLAEYTAKLTPNQVDLIYNAGREAAAEHYRARQEKVKAEQEKANAKKKAAADEKATTKKGGVYYGYDGKTIDQRRVDEKHKKLTKAQSVGVDFVKRMAKRFGMPFYFYESYKDADGNWVYQDAEGNVVPAEDGFYDPSDGSIHIDLNAGHNGSGKVLFVIAHELVHHIKERSPAHFKMMADIVVQNFNTRDVPLDKLIADEQVAALERGRKLTEDEAFEEVIAHSLEGILADGKVMELMKALEAKDKSLGARVKRFFKNIAQLIKDTIDVYRGVTPDSIEGRMIMHMKDVYAQLQEAFAEGLYEAGTNLQTAEENTTGEGGVKYAIAVLENGNVFVKASRNVITGITKAEQRKNITDFFNSLLDGNNSLDIPTIEGDVLTITKSETADKARDDHKTVSGQSVPLSDVEFAVKLRIAAHIDEISEVSKLPKNTKKVTDGKNHPFAKDGFTYRRAYFEDFDGQYYEITISVGHNGTVATVYNVGKIDKSALPSAKIIAVVGSQPLGKAPSKSSIRNSLRDVKEKDSPKSDTRKFATRRSAVDNRRHQPPVADMLRLENEKLKSDVVKLNELLQLQRTVTNGTKFTPTSVEAAARLLKKQANATGNTAELAELLNSFYNYIATEKELTWDGVKKQAQAAVDWLQDHVKQQRSEYAQEILDQLHGSRIYLDESQKAEAAYRFGSFNEFRKSLMGSVTIANEANMSLDSLWHEMSSLYPYMFDSEMTAAEMPGALADIIDQLRNEDTSFMEYEYNRELIAQDLVRQVYDSYWNVSTLRTFADVKQGQINRLKSEHSQRMNKLRSENREKIEQIKAEHRAEVDILRKAYRQKLETQQKNLSVKYQESRKRDVERRKESAAVSKQRNKVEKQVKALMTMLAHPTKETHVPQSLQAPLQEFLDSIDFTSKSQNAGQAPTIRDVYYTRALMEIRDAIAAQSSAMRGAEDGIYALDVPESFLLEIDKHIQTIHSATKGLDLTTNRLYDMNSAELSDLSHILGVINKTIRDIDLLHMAGAKARISELGKSTMTELSGRKAVRTDDGYKAMWANYTPYYAFRRMGKAAQQIFRGLTQGQAKLAKTIKAVLDFANDTYEDKDVKTWENETHDIKLDSGQTVKLTTAQLMSFYCLSKRKHAKGHLTGGGIRVGVINYDAVDAIKNRSKKVVQKEHYVLTENDISTINELLAKNPKALSVAKSLQQFMQDYGGRLINEVSMARWDYMAATEQDYFPIRTDDLTRDARSPDQDRTNLWALLNKSFTKGLTEGANNTVIVDSIFDVFADHMSECAEYNAFALPLVDAMRWFNYRERVKLDGSQVKDVGVQRSLEAALGKAAIKYFTDLMTDINGSQKAGRYENLAGKVLSRAKVSKVAWNLRVAIQQPTAILRASLVLDIPSLMNGTLRVGTKKLVQEMQEYSGIALWKSMGYYDLNVSRGVREQIKGNQSILDKVNDAGMWLPGKMDQWTWARIWAACKSKVSKEQNLTGESLLKATADLFEDVVYQTQVADSVLTRSALMRSKSQTVKEATAFMAEPTLTYNILLSAFQDYESGHTTWQKARRGIMIGFYGYAMSSVANAIITSLVDAWRDDDEYETFWEKFRQALMGEKSFTEGNLFGELNPLEKIVFVKDIISRAKGYSNSSSYADIVDSIIGLFDVIKNFSEGKGTLTHYGVLYKCLQTLDTVSGAGFAGIAREAAAIWNNTIGKMYPDLLLHTKKESTTTKVRNAYETGALTEEEAMLILVRDGAVETEDDAYFVVQKWNAGSDYSRYDAIYDQVLNGGDIEAAMEELTSHGYTEKDVLSQVKSQISKWYKNGEITKEQATNMLAKYIGMDSDDITAAVNKWSSKVVTGIAFEDIKDEFLSGNITAAKAVDMYVTYGGYTKEKATETVSEWRAEKETGIAYDDIKDAFMDGEITQGDAKNMYITYGGYSEAEASEKVAVLDFVKKHPEADGISFAAVESFQTHCESAGVPATTFYEVWKYDANADADVDANGKSISGSKKAKVLAYIHSQNLTSAQKDSLYYAFGWAESKIYEAPWN